MPEKFGNDTIINQELTGILLELAKFSRKYGIQTLLKKLQQTNDEGSDNQLILNFILEKIESHFKITRQDLTRTKRENTDARKICILLFYEHLSLSTGAVMNYFNRNKSGFFIIKKDFESLRKNPVTQEGRKFVSNYNYLNDEIIKFKENLKSKKKFK